VTEIDFVADKHLRRSPTAKPKSWCGFPPSLALRLLAADASVRCRPAIWSLSILSLLNDESSRWWFWARILDVRACRSGRQSWPEPRATSPVRGLCARYRAL